MSEPMPAPPRRRRPGEPLPSGSEWRFDLIERYDREIARVAEGYKLDTYPNQIEIISAEQMMRVGWPEPSDIMRRRQRCGSGSGSR